MPVSRRLLLLVLPAVLLLGAHAWRAPAAAATGRWPVSPPTVLRGFDPPAETWGAGHRGIDLAAAVGQPVLAPVDGTVTFAGPVAARGVVVITRADGLRTTLEPVLAGVPVGARVAAGDPVGTVAAGPHCGWTPCIHWGLRRGDTYLDPRTLLGLVPPVLLPLGSGDVRSGQPGDADPPAGWFTAPASAARGDAAPTDAPLGRRPSDGSLPASRQTVQLLRRLGELAAQLQHRLGVHLADP